MDVLCSKCIERCGKGGFRLLVTSLRRSSVDTSEAFRNVLRSLQIWISDNQFDELCQQFSGNTYSSATNTRFDLNSFISELLKRIPYVRRSVLDLTWKSFTKTSSETLPESVVSFETVVKCYDVSRKPNFLSGIETQEEAMHKFLSLFEDLIDTGITHEEFEAFYLGVSMVTPVDQDFLLLLIRSFSLDRPKMELDSMFQYFLNIRRIKDGDFRKDNVFYTTESSEIGKECFGDLVPPKFPLNNHYSKNLPNRRGAATEMNL